MPNLPNNQIVLDQSDRGDYPNEALETFETGAHEWRSLTKDNPSYFHAVPHKDGKFSSQEYQANGHLHEITNSTKSTQQDSRTDGTTNNRQTQVGGGDRTVNGQGEHRERGGDDTKAVAGSTIAISKSSYTHISKENGHQAVEGDQGFYVKGGGYSIGVEENMVITSNKTTHVESEGEISLKGIQNVGITTKGKMTFDSEDSMLANTSSTFTANSADNMSLNTQASLSANAAENITQQAGADISIEAGSSITLTVGSSTITMTDGLIELQSGIVKVNNMQVTPTSSIFI